MKKLRHNLALVLIIALFAAYCGGRTDNANNAESGITGSGQATTPPSVNSIIPTAGANNVYRDAAITITFGVIVNPGTVTLTSTTACSGSVQLSTDGFTTCIPMNQTVTQSGTQITVRTAAEMAASTLHTVRITTAVAGPTGLTIQAPYESQFTTGTTIAPLPGAFGTCAGGNTLDEVRADANGAISRSVAGLIVTAVDVAGHFFVQQSGVTGPGIYVRDTTNNPNLGVQVGDILCLSIGQKSEFNQWMRIDTLTAALKSSGGGSVTAQNLTAAASDSFESEIVSVTGSLTTKSTFSGSRNHTLTYPGGTITIREIDGSGKFNDIFQGQNITVVAPLIQNNADYRLYVDSRVGTVTESTSGNFNVASAAATGANTLVLTFNNTPTAAAANNAANYTGNNGLTISGASLSGTTVTLTTSNQTVGQSYTIMVANVLRNADNAALTMNTANFTGYAPPASFSTGQVVINEVHIAPTPAAEEYIELYNTTASAISLNGATLWYKSQGGVPGQATTLTGVIPANGYYTVLAVASPTSYTCAGTLQTTGWGNSGLAAAAGAVILTVDGTAPTAAGNANVRDIVQWGTNATNWAQDEGGATGPAPSGPRTLARAPNGIDTNNNSRDFLASTAVPNNGTCGAHNWSTDVTPPTIATSTPAIGATDIALSSTISVTFSESIYPTSVTTTNLYLVQGTDCNATSITGAITVANPHTTFSFPSGTLTANTQYSICVRTGVEDIALNNLAADAVRSFTTISPDVTAPSTISTFAAGTITSASVVLNWTAVGDDGGTGTATSYEIRQATGGACPFTDGNFGSTGTVVSAPPTPLAAGNAQTKTVTGLSASTQYWFAIKASDEVPNISAISNCITATTAAPDVTAPSPVTTLATGTVTANSIALNWTAVGDDASTGTATSYEIRQSTGVSCPFNDGNFSSTGTVVGTPPTPQVAGSAETKTVTGLSASTQYWFALKVSDEVPNASTISNCVTGTTSAGSTLVFTDSDFENAAMVLGTNATTNIGCANGSHNACSLSTSEAYTGSRSLRFNKSVTANTTYQFVDINMNSAGANQYITFMFKGTVSGTAPGLRFQVASGGSVVNYYDLNGIVSGSTLTVNPTTGGTYSTTAINVGTWTKVRLNLTGVNWTPNSGTSDFVLRFRVRTTSTHDWYIDDIKFE